MNRSTAIDRVCRWYHFSKNFKPKLTKILVHPNDLPELIKELGTPPIFEGLPVIGLGQQVKW